MRVRGLLKFNGTVGGLTFYDREGLQVARTYNPISRERIMKDKAFEGTRRTMSEFGAASHIAKVLRLALRAGGYQFYGSNVCPRLNKEVMAIISYGNGERGKRSFELSNHLKKLKGFKFMEDTNLASTLDAEFDVGPAPDRHNVLTKVRNLIPSNVYCPLKEATHMRLISMASCLSDYEFDAQLEKYLPLHPELNGLTATSYSVPIELSFDLFYDMDLMVNLPAPVQPMDKVGVVSTLAVEFLQEVNGEYVAFRSGGVMEVV